MLPIHGYPCIALSGVYGFLTKNREGKSLVIPDFNKFNWHKRDVIIVFDPTLPSTKMCNGLRTGLHRADKAQGKGFCHPPTLWARLRQGGRRLRLELRARKTLTTLSVGPSSPKKNLPQKISTRNHALLNSPNLIKSMLWLWSAGSASF